MKHLIFTLVFLHLLAFGFTQTNTWQGDVSSNWHYSGNWSLNHIPTVSEDVVIPDVAGFNPNVYSTAHCNNLTINSGADLELFNSIFFYVHTDAHIFGSITFSDENIYVYLYDDIIWESGSECITNYVSGYNSHFVIYDDWTFEAGSNAILDNVSVIFPPDGSSSSIIECNSTTSEFYWIFMNKSVGKNILLSGASTQDMKVSYYLNITDDNLFYSYSHHDIVVGMYFINDGNFQLVNGGLIITNYFGSIQFNTGDFMNNLEITTSYVGEDILGDAVINGNLTINGDGVVIVNTLELGGHFDNNAGSNTSINQITFNGTDIQNVYSLDCETLILDKPDGELRFPSETSICNNYDWEQGLYRVNGGTFIINDLVDDGIFGTISVTDGQLDIHQGTDPGNYIDLNCTFFMTGGECNIYGGQDDSWWSFAGNTSITMYGGRLCFKDNGVKVANSAYTFDENISGGVIETTGDFIVERTNYNPTGGTLSLSGPSDCIVQHSVGGNLYNVLVEKESKGYAPKNYPRKHRIPKMNSSSKDSQVTAGTHLDINGNFIIEVGTFTPSISMSVAGSWHNLNGDIAFNEGTSEVIFDGDEQAHLLNSETFHDLTINKSYELDAAVLLSPGYTLDVNNDLNILDGSLSIGGENCILNIGNDILIELNAGLYVSDYYVPISIIIGGNWQNNNTSFSSIHGFRPGLSEVTFNGTSNQTIHSNCPSGDFKDFKINSTSSIGSAFNLHILGFVHIAAGTFIAPPEIYVGGSWINDPGESAFDEGTGLVVFNGSSNNAFCFPESFYHLEIDKPGANLYFTSSWVDTTRCVDLDWTAGSYELWDESILIVNDLVDDGIYGDITVNEGALLSLTQGTGALEYVDLNGNLTIDGGEVHVYGGADISFWTYNGDASITMTNDAGLYFEDVGIHIGLKEPFTFSENITGGEIHTAANFIVGRDNFTPTSSHLYMNGPDDAILNVALGSYLSSLDINKSANTGETKNYKKSPRDTKYQNSAKSNHVVCPSDLIIQGDFTIHYGSFSAPSEMWVRRDWVNNVGEGAFFENTGQVTFFGAVDSEIKYDEIFYDLCNEKDFDVRYLRTAENLNTTVLNDLHLNQGVFFTETGNIVEIANTVQFIEGASWWAGNTAISIAGDWDNQCTTQGVYSGFRSQNSTVTFNGMTDQYLSCDYLIEEFNNLIINNTGGTGDESLTPMTNIRVTDDLTITDGNWYDLPSDNVHEFYGDINISNDGRFTDVYGIIMLMGDASQSLINNGIGNFDVIIFNKDNPTDQVNLEGDLIFKFLNINTGDVHMNNHNYSNQSGIFVQADASLNLEAGANLVSDPDAVITVYAGGKIAFNGTNGNNCVVTINGGPGYYYFNIEGEIAAEYTDFSNMAADGISVLPAGSVDPFHAFNNCSFSSGETGGAYLAVNSNQNLTCDGAIFYSNIWGGSNNVRKVSDHGEITFTNYSGDFAGEDYDFDPFDRIQWDDGSREIDLTVMLEGPYNSGVMKTSLNDKNLLPSAQPYNISPWNYTGTESVPNMPNPDIVDWILIEYRDAFDANLAIPATMVAQEAAFLLNDGSIVDLDGSSIIPFDHSINQSLFVVIYHRNHLGIMSANPVTETGGVYTYDFTAPAGQASGTDAQKDLGGGIYGLFGGDANADGSINTDDKTTMWSIEVGSSGYLNSDFNMDSQADNSDKNDFWIENNGNSSQIPD